MIKNKGNYSKAVSELKGNVATAFLYENETNKDGILDGTVITLKDIYATKDAPTQASSKILEKFTPGYDATIVKKLRDAGGSIVAKVHLDELALGGSGQYSAYGKINNPLDPKRISGGSSSGSIATFTNSIGIAIGSDTGDSVRLPASYNGAIGFKPSYGAISRYGQFAYASSLDTVGYFAHNVEDIIAISNVLFGQDENDMSSKDIAKPINKIAKPKTVGTLKNSIGLKDYQIEKYAELKQTLINDGIEVIEFELNQKLLDNLDVVYQAISFAEAASNDANLNGISFGPGKDGEDWNEIMNNTRSELLGDLVQRRFTLGAFYTTNENIKPIFEKAQKVRRLIVDEFKKIKEQVDTLIFPATTIAPFVTDEKDDSWVGSYLINSNLSGTPSIVIPWGKHKNMPFGLALDGLLYKDRELLSNALYIEKLIGGNNE